MKGFSQRYSTCSLRGKFLVEDILNTCRSDPELKEKCKSAGYNALWRTKISEEFYTDYEGSDAYHEYKRLLVNQKLTERGFETVYSLVLNEFDHEIGDSYFRDQRS